MIPFDCVHGQPKGNRRNKRGVHRHNKMQTSRSSNNHVSFCPTAIVLTVHGQDHDSVLKRRHRRTRKHKQRMLCPITSPTPSPSLYVLLFHRVSVQSIRQLRSNTDSPNNSVVPVMNRCFLQSLREQANTVALEHVVQQSKLVTVYVRIAHLVLHMSFAAEE